MKRILNILLIASLLLTLSVPLTGLIVHKMASALFLLLCAVHTAVYRKKLRARARAGGRRADRIRQRRFLSGV